MVDRLKSIRVRGLTSLADVTFRPGPFTVVIGPNGVGKSNLVGAFELLDAMKGFRLQEYVAKKGGASQLLHYGPEETGSIIFDLELDLADSLVEYHFELAFAEGDRLFIKRETVRSTLEGAPCEVDLGRARDESSLTHHGIGVGFLKESEAKPKFVRDLYLWRVEMSPFHVQNTSPTSPLRLGVSYNEDRTLWSTAMNLAAILERLKSSQDADERRAFEQINQVVRWIAPSVRRLQPTIDPSDNEIVRLAWEDDRGVRWGVNRLSDGTLRGLAIATVLSLPSSMRPKFVCIDEPELGLHPTALHLLMELARSVTHETQVVFSTQSERLLDHAQLEEVTVADRENHTTVLRTFDNKSEVNHWLEEYTLSQVYEMNLLGGKP